MHCWTPSRSVIENSNIYKMMQEINIDSYQDFWRWSVENKELFWETTANKLGVVFDENYKEVLNLEGGVENARWFYGAKMNIVDSCFQNDADSISVIVNDASGTLKRYSQKQLDHKVNQIANGIVNAGLKPKDVVAIYMPMNFEAVAIYLAAIKAGLVVATIADSFSEAEIAVRLKITKPKILFTQDGFVRADRIHYLYKRCVSIGGYKSVVVQKLRHDSSLEKHDVTFDDFISSKISFTSIKVDPSQAMTILFSSGTTGEPKAIPWNHSTPIKSASDGYYHHDIHKGNVVCWPTNLGWMMGPWLVFAALMNKASIALYEGSPIESEFGEFVEKANVTMLGVVPSIVKSWKISKTMESYDWNSIRCFSSTGEVSNPTDMEYLMQLANVKPIIEYCGGTEIGGGYIASTVLQDNIPSQFSSQALGGEFVLLDEIGEQSAKGEVFIIPPVLGLSTTLLNRNHHEVYYKDVPKFKAKKLRKHGDEMQRLESGYYKANGRVDDTMNLGGIKVAAVQIESIVNGLDFVKESAAIGVSANGGGPNELIIYYVPLHTNSEKSALKKVQNCVKSELNPLFKVVDLVEIDNLPRTASKKVKRKELREKYQQNR